MVDPELSDYSLMKDYKFKRITQLLLNSITGGHTIKMMIQDKQKNPIEC